MRGKDHARIHTRRNDSNRRPSGSRRRTSLDAPRWLPSKEEAEDLGLSAFEERFLAAQIDWQREAAAGDQSVDGVHPGDARET